jgi:O-antigen ligase/tetratricopeptide (TPR) repeat protein
MPDDSTTNPVVRDSGSHGSKRRRHRSRQPLQFGGKASVAARSEPWLVTATDVCLALTFVLVALGFGGRAAIGQFFLVAGALVTSGCWLLHQLTKSNGKYTWTGSEWLWCAGLLVAGFQIVPLPQSWLLTLSPHLKELLPIAFINAAIGPLSDGWNQLSLAPGETASGLATFAAYGLLFLVVAQRVRTVADVERILCATAVAATAMGGFALLQYLFSNDKYFWTVDHPFMTTGQSALGCFTNRNHLAQFLALGIGPLIWWTLRRFHDQENPHSGGKELTPEFHRMAVLALLLALGITVLASLLCYSRGGLLSLGIAAGVSFGLLCRMNLASAKLGLGLAVAGAVIGGIFLATGYEKLENRLAGGVSDTSIESRLVIWKANFDVARDFPWLGTGIGTHADAYHLHFDKENEDILEYTHAECGYLQVLSESGLCGLLVALAFIAVSLRICVRVLWHPDLRCRSAAAAVLASLLANVGHAAFDFFWYTPSCMLLLAIQLAAILRLSRSMPAQAAMEAQAAESQAEMAPSDDLSAPGLRLPRILTLVVACGLVAVGGWMLGHKVPAARAEPDRMRYLMLAHHQTGQDSGKGTDDGTDDDAANDEELADERGGFVLRAARLNPADSHLQESAGMEYLRRFDARQMTSDNQLEVGQIRDAVKSSEFKTTREMKEWLDSAVGNNARLLQLAARSFNRAIKASPLRAYSYVKVAELGFLNLIGNDDELVLLKQALKLRPHDPQVLYQVGRNVMISGDVEGALAYWRDAFSRSRNIQSIVVRQLASQVEPEFFLDKLKPDWEAQGLIARAYQEYDRMDEARRMWEMHVDEGMKRLKSATPPPRLEATVLSLHEACVGLEERELATKVLTRGLQLAPQSYAIRNRLAWDLYGNGRYAEAAEHLKWCASRRPDDKPLQSAAAAAVKQSLKTATVDPSEKSG